MGRVSKVSAAQPRSLPSSATISSPSTSSSSALLGTGNLAGSNGHIQHSTIMGITIGLLSKSAKAHEHATASALEAREDTFHELEPIRGVKFTPGSHQHKPITAAAPAQAVRAVPEGTAPQLHVLIPLERTASFSSSSAASTILAPPPAYEPESRSRR